MNDPLYEYIERNSTRQTEALDWVERQTHLRSIYSHMLCGPVEGRLLNLLTSMIRPERALELGVFTGYSSICIASALPAGAHLDALEINDELEDVIRGGYARAGVEDRINLILGNANESLSQLSGPYDLVFIDANKREYVKYYNAVIDKVRPGGFILADNVLWSGKVLEMEHVSGSGAHHTDAQTKGIMEFNELVANDPRVENVIIPLRDGLNIIRKK
ncbi:MAG: O-methyltransferase [Bacteroidales bacterium]|nr:O-methyltransferase [Candidatus Egerieousia equi]MCQ2117322.1 O-methyltransferase [Bacteroidales bacterium]